MENENEILWTSGFINERILAPISPLGWSHIGPFIEELALRIEILRVEIERREFAAGALRPVDVGDHRQDRARMLPHLARAALGHDDELP